MKKDINYRHYRWNSVQNNGNEIETAKHLQKANAVSDQFPNHFFYNQPQKWMKQNGKKELKQKQKDQGGGLPLSKSLMVNVNN